MVSKRYIRDFKLVISVGTSEITVLPPLRIVFTASKSISGQLNKMLLKVYNLNPDKRNSIVKDVDQQKLIGISLFVGYDHKSELVFKGTVNKCSNQREGADIVTTINSLDGGYDFINSFTSKTVEVPEWVIDEILEDMPNTSKGKITPRPTLTRPKVLCGNSCRLIDDMIGEDEEWYIDDETLNIIKTNDVTSDFIPVISAKTGLISTPTREASIVEFVQQIDPSVKIGRMVRLISTTAPHLNGIYKIIDIDYDGDNYGTDWSQTCRGLPITDAVIL